MKITFLGVAVTAVYFVVVFFLIDFSKLTELTPNELGDFLAGVFGAPALIWVVISFFVQSRELAASVEALDIQSKELAASAEQQRELVKANNKASLLEMERYQKSLRLDALKMLSEIQRDVEFLPRLFEHARESKKAMLAMFGMAESGAAISSIEEISNMEALLENLIDEFQALDRIELENNSEDIEEIVAAIYRTRNRVNLLRRQVEGSIESDVREREIHWQASMALRPASPVPAPRR